VEFQAEAAAVVAISRGVATALMGV